MYSLYRVVSKPSKRIRWQKISTNINPLPDVSYPAPSIPDPGCVDNVSMSTATRTFVFNIPSTVIFASFMERGALNNTQGFSLEINIS